MSSPTPFADAVLKHPHNDMSSDLFRNSVQFIYTSAGFCRKWTERTLPGRRRHRREPILTAVYAVQDTTASDCRTCARPAPEVPGSVDGRAGLPGNCI